jgi:uncharacterized membrane protein YedE/YeeE
MTEMKNQKKEKKMDVLVYPLIGGGLIGLAASLFLLTHGKVAGISGILGGLLVGTNEDKPWRFFFLLGLIISGMVYAFFDATAFSNTVQKGPVITIIAGLLVGFGTQLGNGCTSGHGICGIARGSLRSIMATITFMITGMIGTYLVQYIIG